MHVESSFVIQFINFCIMLLLFLYAKSHKLCKFIKIKKVCA